MKKLTILLLTFFLAGPLAGNLILAQEYSQPEVTVSKERVRLGGKVYYSHVVLEKQTLFSVAKAYGVTMQDIIDANPSYDLKNTGLRKNQIILIPADMVKTAASPAEDKAVQEDKKGTEEAQEAASPASKGKKDFLSSLNLKGEKEYFIHIVKWYEDLSDIAEKYGMSQEAIMKYNGMKTPKVKKKMRLKIPYKPQEDILPEGGEAPAEDEAQAPAPEEEAAGETGDTPENAGEAEDSTQVSERDIPWYKTIFSGKKDVNVSLLFPLGADRTVNENFADFYAGALLAARDLGGKDGINLDINVYDVASGNIPLTRENFSGSDLVIGPVSKKDIESALSVCPSDKLIISPLDPGAASLAMTAPNLVQAPAPSWRQYEDIVEWVREEMGADDRVLLITEKEAKDTTAQSSITAALNRAGISYRTLSYGILEGRNIDRTMGELLSKDVPGRVILASESEAFVGDVVRNLNLLIHAKYPVTLYSPSKIRSFDTIDVESLHNVNLHVSSTYFIDYDDPGVRDFLMAYRALYRTEPTQFAYQGYDVMNYFVRMYSKYGRNWYKMAVRERESGLQADYALTECKGGGFINGAIRRVIYDPGFTVSRVNAKQQ